MIAEIAYEETGHDDLKKRATCDHHELAERSEDEVTSFVYNQVHSVYQMPLIRIVRAPEEIGARNQSDD